MGSYMGSQSCVGQGRELEKGQKEDRLKLHLNNL